jgi:hypothetical protein
MRWPAIGMIHPLVWREWRRQPRQRWFYAKRLAILVLLTGCVAWGYAFQLMGGYQGSSQPVGLYLFSGLAFGLMTLALLLGMPMGASVIVPEWRDRTLGLLVLTGQSPSWLLLARSQVLAFTVGQYAVGVLPLVMLCLSLGGLDLTVVCQALILVVASFAMGAGLGMWLGCLTGSVAWLLALLPIYLITLEAAIPPFCQFLGQSLRAQGWMDWTVYVEFSGPMWLMMRVLHGGIPWPGLVAPIVAALGVGLAGALLASRFLSRPGVADTPPGQAVARPASANQPPAPPRQRNLLALAAGFAD